MANDEKELRLLPIVTGVFVTILILTPPLENAVARDPGNAAALYQLGLAYKRQGKVEKSRQTLQEFQRAKARMRDEETELVQILKTLQPAR